jgi:formylglycine-generating enzyme
LLGTLPGLYADEPMVNMKWRDAVVWSNAYSQLQGLTPVYYSDAGFTAPIKDARDGSYSGTVNVTPGSYDNPYVNWSANGYRLPTEGEWQYAARYINGISWLPYNYASGATADYNDTTATGMVAWCLFNSGTMIQNVGTKNPNALDIYDMSGNAREWCWDWYVTYPATSQADYKGPGSGTYRVSAGGDYYNSAYSAQVGFRGYSDPYLWYVNYGFRLARSQ